MQMKNIITAIDVGSTSMRMRVVDFSPNGKGKIVEELVYPVATGRDTFADRKISAKTLRALCGGLRQFAEISREYRAENIRAVATSALREAENKDIVIDRIWHESGVRLDVLDNIEEGRLICQPLLPFLRQNLAKSKKPVLFMELGGGGTVSMLLRQEKILRANYRRLGTTRFSLLHGFADNDQFGENLVRNAVNSLLAQFEEFPIGECVLLNQPLRKLVARANEKAAIPGGYVLTAAELRRRLDLFNGNPETAADAVAADEAATLLPTLMIVNYLCKKLKLAKCYLIGADLLDAVQSDMYSTSRGKNPVQEFSAQSLLSARGVGEKYNYDEKHALTVATLATQLFDELAAYLDLTERDRLLLEAAATLHDVGSYISDEAHHKHSFYIIQWSEILGVNRAERGLIAMIARYHRKAAPLSSHEDYMKLNLADRLRVTKMAALLRLADALDHAHLQNIKKVGVKIQDDLLLATARSRGDSTIEQQAFKDKSALFTAVTGLRAELRVKTGVE
jgi:exopolyphosphatase/guanosine-5'-triphosphate,3'-diphosphate pyrophosphatase